MTPHELNEYQQRLLALNRRLGRDLPGLQEESRSGTGGDASGLLSDVPLHLADLASHQSEEDVALGLLENEAQAIVEISAALQRITQGTFGRCEECGEEISRDRLQVLPYARHCIACARGLPPKARP